MVPANETVIDMFAELFGLENHFLLDDGDA